MLGRISVAALGAGLLVFASACSKGEKPAAGGAATGAPAAATTGPMGTAAVAGVVKFVGKAPENPAIDMHEEPKCAADYKQTPRQQIVVVNPNGTLANVFVYVKSGIPATAHYAPPATPDTIDQKGCRYHPRVFGIMVGQQLAIENSDGILHNIKAMGKNNRPFNISQPVVMTTVRPGFTTEEVMLPFECNVHGWMHAYAGVLPYPFFSTTGDEGKYSIDSLPAGTYTIEAWHEKYGTKDTTVTVQAGETKTIDFTYSAK
jgi:Carboxypeptidase regulatory-like domain